MADVICLIKTRAFLKMNELQFVSERRMQSLDHVMVESESVVTCSVFFILKICNIFAGTFFSPFSA